MDLLLTGLIKAVLLPPFNIILVAAAGFLTLGRRPRLGRLLILVALAALYALSTRAVGNTLLATLEDAPPLTAARYRDDVGSIVVLGAGLYRGGPEYGGDDLKGQVLERVRYAARLYRETGTPLLVSGGNPNRAALPQAVLMRRSLERDFRVPVRWVEGRSNTTLENARNTAAMLATEGIDTVYLVTHAWHMPRAKAAFEAAGLKVVPASTMFAEPWGASVFDFLPRAEGLRSSRLALHEWLGRLWYRLRS